ncbi:hypothetical protein [Hoylesella marshii]|nr:hypothetical protein [Hoylesella marshii]
MNITSKNRTFVLTEEQGHYAFNGELILDADDHPEFRGSVNPKQGGHLASVYYKETDQNDVSISFSGAQKDAMSVLLELVNLITKAKTAIIEEDNTSNTSLPEKEPEEKEPETEATSPPKNEI